MGTGLLTNANPSVRSISAFFPCYNDARTIESMVRGAGDALAQLVDDFEVIVVDDGSADDSVAVLEHLQAQLPWLRVVVHESNRGYGGALRSGFAACTKDWIFYTDGDGQYDPSEVARLVRVVRPDVGLAQGWKLQRGDGYARAVIGRAYHHLVAWAFSLGTRDTDCDFRLFRRSLVDQTSLQSDSGAICVEMMYRFAEAGAVCVETPVHHFPRPYGRSQFFRVRHLARTFGELASLWIRLRRPFGRRARPVEAPTAPTGSGWSTRARVAGVTAIVVLSLGAHLWGLTRDLPTPNVDERYFVTPAAYMAASGDPNPHWFGHPGSTVIYPLAVAFRLREIVFHGAPLTGAAPAVAERFKADPGSFYLLGRLWAMLFSLAVLPLLFVVGRRVFGDLVAFLATAVWAVVPLAVQYGRITRTDSVALFFALLTIWACLRALERPSRARFAVAGVAAGFGVATRYFLAALAVLLCATWFEARKQQRTDRAVVDGRRADAPVPVSTIAVSLIAMVATFVLTTPFLFIDSHDALKSLSAETVSRVPFESHGFFANLAFYFTNAIPGAVSWIGLAAALCGAGLAVFKRSPAKTLLLVWVASVLVVISVLPLHWNRWVIPALPILALFAAYAAVTLARTFAERPRRLAPHRWVFVATAGIAMLAITIGPATALVTLDRAQDRPSTRAVARTWIEQHIPAGSRIAVEINGPDLTDTAYLHVEHFALPLAGTIDDYARTGYRYLVINERNAARYPAHSDRDPSQKAFYEFLREDARLIADFHADGAHGGPHLKIYDLGPKRTAREKPTAADPGADTDEVTLRPTADNRVRRGGGPVPFARHALHRLAIEADPS